MTAHKCDRCNVLFDRAKGNVHFSYCIDTDDKGSSQAYATEGGDDEFDLCTKCGAEFLEFVRHE